MTTETLLLLIPLFPLLACLTVFVLGPKFLHEKSHWPVVIGCLASFLCSAALLVAVNTQPKTYFAKLYTWVSIPDVDSSGTAPSKSRGADAAPLAGKATKPLFYVPIQLRADSLTAIMLTMVTFISTLVALYASGYMHGERGYWRFFAAVGLFVFSMINLVLAGNLLQLFVFWEAVGLCSYLLIGFWYEKPAAAAAGMKAFVVNRIGDFGFAIGVFLAWRAFGSVEFETILDPANIARVPSDTIALICFCLFCGAMGKSAQFPLHVWLPDAMEGPTPVSALIHAATMVTAGVYMVTRCTPLFQEAPDAQATVAAVGGFTAIMAALIALTQTDLKRVLAYSTVSQLGYMFLGLGAGSVAGIGGGMFHLVTHAFFKALLFLGAGSVMHAMGGVIDMREFSGLRKLMPHTHKTFLIGAIALAGLPPLSGFFSKDTILSAVWVAAHAEATPGDEAGGASHGAPVHPEAAGAHGGTAEEAGHHPAISARAEERRAIPVFGMKQRTLYALLFWMATFTAGLTAFYTFRAYFLTFWGPEKIPAEAGHHAHESPPVMTIPLWILSVGAAGLGLALGHIPGVAEMTGSPGLFATFLGYTIPGAGRHHDTEWFVVVASTVVGVLGVFVAYVMYFQASPWPARMANMFGPLTDLSRNKFYLDEIYATLIVWPLRAIAQMCRFFDWLIVDTVLVDWVGSLPGKVFGKTSRPMQNGLVQFYALSMTLALAVLLWALLLRQG